MRNIFLQLSFSPDNISLNINIDGLPVFKSSKYQFWPILCYISEIHITPFVVGIYGGEGKPSDLDAFLGLFVSEMKKLQDGFTDPESQNGSTNTFDFHFRNIEPEVRVSLTEALLNRLHGSEPEIIETNPSLPTVFYNPNNLTYDMRGEKLHYIFCHENYMNTSYFNFRRPPSRNTARDDADLLVETFDLYGFRYKIYYDMEYEKIIDIIARVSQQDHTRTSCLWVTIMSHATSNALLAADRPYRLSQIEVLLQSANLAGIPKILTLPCIRGGNEMPGVITGLPPQNPESVSWAQPCNAVTDLCCDWVDLAHQLYYEVFKRDCTEIGCPVCGAHNVDEGVTVQCADGKTIVLPRTAGFLFIHAADNDLMSLSFLIRAICEAFQENEELKAENLIPIVNQKVVNNTNSTITPETRVTLTKTLRFTHTEPRRN